MSTVDLKVGYSCNDACVHCVVDDFRDALRQQHHNQDKTTEEIFGELKDGRQRANHVVITGGEPTIRPDFLDIVRYAMELGFTVLLQSNGRMFSRQEFAKQCVELGEIVYCIALHGTRADIHDSVTQRPGSFAETVAGIQNLAQLKQKLIGKVVLSRLNYQVLPELCQHLVELGCPQISIAFPHAQGRARKLWDTVVPRYGEVSPYVIKALDWLERRNIPVDAETFPFCCLPGYVHHIAELAQQLEEYVELNQYGSDSGPVNWCKLRPEIKTKFTQCQKCRFTAVCEGPWNEYAAMYGGEEFVAVPGQFVYNARQVVSGEYLRQFAAALSCLP